MIFGGFNPYYNGIAAGSRILMQVFDSQINVWYLLSLYLLIYNMSKSYKAC